MQQKNADTTKNIRYLPGNATRKRYTWYTVLKDITSRSGHSGPVLVLEKKNENKNYSHRFIRSPIDSLPTALVHSFTDSPAHPLLPTTVYSSKPLLLIRSNIPHLKRI